MAIGPHAEKRTRKRKRQGTNAHVQRLGRIADLDVGCVHGLQTRRYGTVLHQGRTDQPLVAVFIVSGHPTLIAQQNMNPIPIDFGMGESLEAPARR